MDNPEPDSAEARPADDEVRKGQTGWMSHNRGVFEATLEDIPFARAIASFFVREGKAVKNGWLAMIIVTGIALWAGKGWGEQRVAQLRSDIQMLTGRIKSLKQDNDRAVDTLKRDVTHRINDLTQSNNNLTRDNQLYSQRNTDLQVTVAPLLARAAKEFPGEEINISLKKIVDELEKQNPLNQPIASATATAVLELATDQQINSTCMDAHWIAFGRGDQALLMATSNQSLVQVISPARLSVRLTCTAIPDSQYMGKPVASLLSVEYIEMLILPNTLKQPTVVVTGTVTWVINGNLSLTFKVPDQPLNAFQVFIRNLNDGLQPLKGH